MKIGDLIRITNCCDYAGNHMRGYIMYITEVLDEGINVILLEGPYIGKEHFLPYESREFEVISD